MRRNAVVVFSPGLVSDRLGIGELIRLLGLPPAVRFHHNPSELVYETENFTLRAGNGRIEAFSDRISGKSLAESLAKLLKSLRLEGKKTVISETVFIEGDPPRKKVFQFVKRPQFLIGELQNLTVGYNTKTDEAKTTLQITTTETGVQVEVTVEADGLSDGVRVLENTVVVLRKEGFWRG